MQKLSIETEQWNLGTWHWLRQVATSMQPIIVRAPSVQPSARWCTQYWSLLCVCVHVCLYALYVFMCVRVCMCSHKTYPTVLFTFTLWSQPLTMACSLPFIILVAALLINTFSYCSTENVYCVTPIAMSCSSCPHNSINCTTLSEYVQNAEIYFTFNTTMVFLPRAHALDTNITVAKITRLTMLGESFSGNTVKIVCSESVGLSFTSIKNLKIYSVAFTSCSKKGSNLPASNFSLLLQSTPHAELVNCSFHDNFGNALVVINTNITLTGNSDFRHNHCAITALSSNLAITGNITFLMLNCWFHWS